MTDDELKCLRAVRSLLEGIPFESQSLVLTTALGACAIEASPPCGMSHIAQVTAETLMDVPNIYGSLMYLLGQLEEN